VRSAGLDAPGLIRSAPGLDVLDDTSDAAPAFISGGYRKEGQARGLARRASSKVLEISQGRLLGRGIVRPGTCPSFEEQDAVPEREPRMIGIARGLASLLLTAELMVLGTWGAHAETEVDLALVLAVDVSLSMEMDEQELQRQGFVEAFRSPEVHEAIRTGMLGRIAVTYVEWAGAGYQEVVVPWTVIEQPADGHAFAARLAANPVQRFGYTSVSGAIDFSLGQLRRSCTSGERNASTNPCRWSSCSSVSIDSETSTTSISTSATASSGGQEPS
jgi:hypothetical protein